MSPLNHNQIAVRIEPFPKALYILFHHIKSPTNLFRVRFTSDAPLPPDRFTMQAPNHPNLDPIPAPKRRIPPSTPHLRAPSPPHFPPPPVAGHGFAIPACQPRVTDREDVSQNVVQMGLILTKTLESKHKLALFGKKKSHAFLPHHPILEKSPQSPQPFPPPLRVSAFTLIPFGKTAHPPLQSLAPWN